MKRGRVYVVEWEDSAGPQSMWISQDEDVKPVIATSVGYLTHKSKRHITIASSLTSSQQGAVTSIPRSALRSVKRLA